MINTFNIDIIPHNDEKRLAALHRYQFLDTAPEEVFNNFAHLIAEVFDVPIALISLVDKDRVFFKGNVGMTGVKHVDRGVSLCSLAVLSSEPTIVINPLEDPCLLANPLVHGDFGLRFYAGAPIITEDGYNIGTVCILDKKERAFSEKDKEKLVRFSKAVMHTIESRLVRLKQVEIQEEVHQKNKELQQIYQELQFLTNTVPQLVWARDNDGRVVYLNDRWTQYTNLPSELLKESGWGLVLHPEDAERVIKTWQHARINNIEYEVEYRLKRGDGKYRWFLGRAAPLKNEDGDVVKWYGTSTDIDDQKHFREQLEMKVQERTTDLEKQRNLLDSILKNSPSGITVYKVIRGADQSVRDFQCVLANDAAETFTGITHQQRMQNTVLQLTPGLDQNVLWPKIVDAIQNGLSFRTEYYYEPGDAWLELSVVKMDEQHLINVFRDITGIKVAQMQLEKNVTALQQANSELEYFTYAASHDMKEPIRKVHMFTDRLLNSLEPILSKDQKHYFDRLKAAAHRMNSLIDDLLIYTQVNRETPVAQQVNLNEVIRMVESDLELEIEETNAIIQVDPLIEVNGHARQIQQIFHNLLSNAIKYRKQNESPNIRISCTKVKASESGLKLTNEELQNDFYRIDIADNGIGFDLKYAERIFGMFQRLHSSEYKGTGIGLSIVRKAIQNHGGYVQAISTPMSGAVFQVFFPVQKQKPVVASINKNTVEA